MLLNVNVKNLALIKQADVYFNEGMNILTGETGAGKSIIIGSILIALGGKIPKDMIREDEKEALVELVFQIQDGETKEKLREQGIETEEDGQVIISRKIMNGRSLIKVNGESFTAGNLKKVTELLIDIHGQHDHQSLLKQSRHLEILDDFSEKTSGDVKSQVRQTYKEWKELRKSLEEFDMDDETRNREISFCQFEINEIDEAALQPGEYEKLEELYKKMSSSKQLLETMNEVYGYTGYENDYSASEQIGRASSLIQSLLPLDSSLESLASSLMDLEAICQDVNRNIKAYVEELAFDEEQTVETEARLDLLNKFRQKYANLADRSEVTEKILEYRDRQKEKLDKLLHLEEQKNEMLRLTAEKEQQLKKLSDILSEIRKKQAKKLEKDIVSVLKGLNFLDVKFEISFSKRLDFSENGTDEVEFMISTNPGEPLRSLAKIASGGELSRIMLGIKTIMASKDNIDTLIFDEIDTGISGRTAQMVAERMKEISHVHQIICITHLPQIAAMADMHFLIEKSVVRRETITAIHRLNENESIAEIARMLSGSQITETVLENAREMKKLNSNI
ncbi:MAG: DNA repair protein RecN [Lachnospiraceae bacterium]|nr:DNA repair protein RecN [Lachnospiraceae bacterium]